MSWAQLIPPCSASISGSKGPASRGSLSGSARTSLTVKANPHATLVLQRASREDLIADSDIGLEVRELDNCLVTGLHVLSSQLHRLITVAFGIDSLDVLGTGSFQQLADLVANLAAEGDVAFLV